MPSFTIAGKSKEDLVAIAQIAGLLTVSKARRMSKADLAAFLEQENIKAADAAPDAKPVEDTVTQTAPEPEPLQRKTATRRTRRSRTDQEKPDTVAATGDATAEEAVSAESQAKAPARRRAGRRADKTAATAEPAVAADEQTPGRSRSTARRRRKKDDGLEAQQLALDSVETAQTETTSDAEQQPQKTTARRKRSGGRTRQSVTEQPAVAKTAEKTADSAVDRIETATEPMKTAEAELPQPPSAVDEPSPEATEAASEKEDRDDAGRHKKSTAGNRRPSADYSGSISRIPRSRISTRQIRPVEAENEAVPTDTVDAAERNNAAATDDAAATTAETADATATEEQKTEPQHTSADPATEQPREKRPAAESGDLQGGVLEVMPDGYGFLRKDNYLQGNKDIYVPPQYIRRFGLRPGDFVTGPVRLQRENDRYQALLYIKDVNGMPPEKMIRRPHFDRLTPIYPDERFVLETVRNELSTRIIDLVAPIGKGQRGMIVSPPKAGKTIILQKIANAVSINNPGTKLIVLLIDERPEEVTDMQRSIKGEVVYSTFDKTPENHTKVVELVLERAMRLVELKQDVMILLDSMTRLARAYNLTINPTGRTLSGGLDPGALYGPKRFFGAARNIENGGSLTIIATSLIETGSRMDEVIFEEFKGTGNMEVYLDRKLSEKRIFPAIDINKSGTRREELLMNNRELDAVWTIRKAFGQLDTAAVTEAIINLLLKTKNNEHFISSVNVSFNDKNVFEAMRGTRPGNQSSGTGTNGGYNSGSNYNSGGGSYNSNYRRFQGNSQNVDD